MTLYKGKGIVLSSINSGGISSLFSGKIGQQTGTRIKIQLPKQMLPRLQ